MTDLTDEQLREWRVSPYGWHGAVIPLIDELLALRARAAQLKAALCHVADLSPPDVRAYIVKHLTQPPESGSTPFDLAAHLIRQRSFSKKIFGPGRRTKGVCDHIRKELAEIEGPPVDNSEWIDVIILAFDGALRAGWEPEPLIDAIVAKQAKNEARRWPDWRTAAPDKAIEHDRSAE